MFDREEPSRVAHAALSESYRSRYVSGDSEAPFEYVSRDAWAFRAPWLQQVIEHWRDTDAQDKLERLMSRYAARDGKRKSATILDQIRRDQRVYADLLQHGATHGTLHLALEAVGSRHALSPQAVKEIRDHYNGLWRQVEGLGLFRTPVEMLADLQATIAHVATEADPT